MSDSLGSHGQCLDVAGTVEQLVLEREVAEQRLVERLGLLGQRLDGGGGAAEERPDHVGVTAQVADRGLDRLGAGTPVGGVLGQFTTDGVGPGLGHSGLGDLDLGVGQIEHGTKLCDQGIGAGVGHSWFAPSALMYFVGAGCTCLDAYPTSRWVTVWAVDCERGLNRVGFHHRHPGMA